MTIVNRKMNTEMVDKLIDYLFILLSSLNTLLDRLDTITDRQETLLQKNDEVFTKMREEFFRKIIEHEVNKEIEKNKHSKERSKKFGSDVVR